MKRRTRIKPISDRRQEQLKEYARLKRAWFKLNPTCFVQGCRQPTSDVHHQFGRVGNLLNATEYWIPLCRTCHIRVHADKKWARDNALLAPYGQWLNPKKK